MFKSSGALLFVRFVGVDLRWTEATAERSKREKDPDDERQQ